jgi:hypothetical protein
MFHVTTRIHATMAAQCPMFIIRRVEHFQYIMLYYFHFEINGVSCNLIASQECDFSTFRTPSCAIRAEIAPSFYQSH